MANAQPLEPARGRSRARARSAGSELGHSIAKTLDRREQHVRPLDQLRLEAVAPPYAVLLEGARGRRRSRQLEWRRAARRSSRVAGRQALHVDAYRDPVHLPRPSPVSSTSSSIATFVTWTRSMSSCRRRMVSKQASNSGKPGVPGRPWKYATPRRFPRLLEVVQEERELARRGRRTGCRTAAAHRPGRPDAQARAVRSQVTGLVLEDPAGCVDRHEQPRVRSASLACARRSRHAGGRASERRRARPAIATARASEAADARRSRARARRRSRSASTRSCTSSSKSTVGDQPSRSRALVESPTRS